MGSIILGVILLLVCYLIISLYYAWPYLLVCAGVVALILLLLYLTIGKRECKYCGKKYNTLSNKPCPLCDSIDFNNIETVDIINCVMTYRIETEEEFDPVMTDFLTKQDGWQHYETKTVEYEVENGYEYTFLICCFNGKEETRVYHESSGFAQRLISISEKNSLVLTINKGLANLSEGLRTGSIFCNGYENAVESFGQLSQLYGLNASSTDDDFIKACEIKITSILTAAEEERVNALCELMCFLLCENEADADLLDYPLDQKVSFTQKHSGGTDAFCVLEYGADVDNNIVLEYDNYRFQKGYRKICLITVGSNNSSLMSETVLVWDMKQLVRAYYKAFKKIIDIEGK